MSISHCFVTSIYLISIELASDHLVCLRAFFIVVLSAHDRAHNVRRNVDRERRERIEIDGDDTKLDGSGMIKILQNFSGTQPISRMVIAFI